MSRYRLYPSAEQAERLLQHCAHARFIWNLAQEQRGDYRPGRGQTPTLAEQGRQLTEARAAEPWLAAGPYVVQSQALRDLDQAWQQFFRGTHGRPGFRKQGRHEGFRIVGPRGRTWEVRRLNRRWGEVQIPKIGWVRFRWSRAVPAEAKSYRVNLDRSGRWHVAFAATPKPIAGPGTGEVVGIDRGVASTLALSNGEMANAPAPRDGRRQYRRLSRAKRGSNRRMQAKSRLARIRAHDKDRRKDWAEKASTDIARRFDVIRIENLKIGNMVRSAKGTIDAPGRNVRQKARLSGAILVQGWGLFAKRLEDKAPGRVEKINPAFTSQRCSCCGHIARESRESQALFRCVACGHSDNADVNAAKNIAAGYAVTARGGSRLEPPNREPQIAA